MYSQHVVLDLVGLVYAAAGGPALWPVFLLMEGKSLPAIAEELCYI